MPTLTVHLQVLFQLSVLDVWRRACSACPGDPSACLGAVGLLGSDWQDRERDDSGPSLKGKKNLYVNPPRRGGCGSSLQDRTIGQNPPKYMPDPYQNGRELGRELRRKARARIPKPFNSAPNSGAGLFNANPHGYSPGPAYVEEKKAAADEKEKRKAFKPVNPPPTGAAYCTLSSIGRDYVSEPVKEAEVRLPSILSRILRTYTVHQALVLIPT